ncbi:hypothetical protein [Streptomyces sp. PRh5]|uniref:hypothetical protein n=1 Tax=Streptomyces sp. PRh5 TaxID=1158056 RepID=UPI0012FEC952|nr:hypothetical protein [Streptomyces sp. PRh5]
MLTPEVCERITAQMDGTEFSTYDERRIWPPIAKFGPVVYGCYLDGELRPGYRQDPRKAGEQWVKAKGADDPMETLIAQIAAAWEGPSAERPWVGRASSQGWCAS